MAENMEHVTDDHGQGTGQEEGGKLERTFTQKEVDEIVKARLARVKGGSSGSSESAHAHDEREQALNRRELELDARDALSSRGISKDLLPLVNCANKETIERSIALITEHMSGKGKGSGYRMTGGTPGNSNHSGHGGGLADSDIRSAMGLKGK